MDKFNFNLQKVLDFRVTSEENKKECFAEAQRKLLREKKILEELNNTKDAAINSNNIFKNSFEYMSFVRYIEHLDSNIKTQGEKTDKAQIDFEEKKNELIKATEERKVMEKLRDRAKEDFNFMSKQKEQKQNDDFALFSFVRHERG